jgi:hypothetical protein
MGDGSEARFFERVYAPEEVAHECRHLGEMRFQQPVPAVERCDGA